MPSALRGNVSCPATGQVGGRGSQSHVKLPSEPMREGRTFARFVDETWGQSAMIRGKVTDKHAVGSPRPKAAEEHPHARTLVWDGSDRMRSSAPHVLPRAVKIRLTFDLSGSP